MYLVKCFLGLCIFVFSISPSFALSSELENVTVEVTELEQFQTRDFEYLTCRTIEVYESGRVNLDHSISINFSPRSEEEIKVKLSGNAEKFKTFPNYPSESRMGIGGGFKREGKLSNFPSLIIKSKIEDESKAEDWTSFNNANYGETSFPLLGIMNFPIQCNYYPVRENPSLFQTVCKTPNQDIYMNVDNRPYGGIPSYNFNWFIFRETSITIFPKSGGKQFNYTTQENHDSLMIDFRTSYTVDILKNNETNSETEEERQFGNVDWNKIYKGTYTISEEPRDIYCSYSEHKLDDYLNLKY